MKSVRNIRLGAALVLLLALGSTTTASAFTFRRHQYRPTTMRMRQTRTYANMSLKMPRKSYARPNIVRAVPKVFFSPMNSHRVMSTTKINVAYKKRYLESAPMRQKLAQRWTPDFSSSTSYLTSTRMQKTVPRRETTTRRPVIRMKSPAKALVVRVQPTRSSVSATQSVKALWGQLRAAD